MSIRAPHFLLMSETTTAEDQNQWRFVLASSAGDSKLVASDVEPAVQGERLELLSVVRGLEALEQPSEVTLLTDSRYVTQGIAHGLSEWRSNDWCWERFGELTPVKNLDLWQRVDHALKFHRVDCRTWRFDEAHAGDAKAAATVASSTTASATEPKIKHPAVSHAARAAAAMQVAESSSAPAGSAKERTSPPARRPAPRRGLLAACRGWVEQTADVVRELHAKVSLEPQS